MDRRKPDLNAQATAEAAMKATTGSLGKSDPSGDLSLPEMDFATFVVSLATSALVQLGEQPEGAPVDVSAPVDFEMAKQSIDILALLKEKTRGNLTDEESQLLDAVLYDVRMRYVAKHEK